MMKLSIQNESEVLNNKAKNRKIITIYRILSYDLIFYYTISYLFLVNVKGLTTAQIVFADSFYPLFKLIFQIPCTLFIQKFGKRNSLIFSNIAVAIFVLLTIGLIDTFTMIISNFFLAFAFVIKAMAEKSTNNAETNPRLRGVFLRIKLTGRCKSMATKAARTMGKIAPKAYLKNK